MKKLTALLAALALALGLTACGRTAAAPAEDGRLRIMAVNFPAYDLARAACGDLAEVQLLLPPGAESHSYEPTPRNIIDVQSSDLFLYTGGESDTWVDTILESLDEPVETLKLMDCVELLEEETMEGMTAHGHDHDHEDHGDHDHELGEVLEADEHVWTSPVNAGRIAAAIAEKAAELDSANAVAYAANAAAYQAQIDELDSRFRAFFAGIDQPVMVFGDRFPLRYFAQEYGVRCLAAFPGCSTQTEPSAATVACLIEEIEEEHLSTVYYIEFSNHLVADSIAEAAGVETALFHSCHNVSRQQLDGGVTYLRLMEENLETLQRTMG